MEEAPAEHPGAAAALSTIQSLNAGRLADLLKDMSELYGLKETSVLLQKVPDYAKDLVRRVEDGRVAPITAADYTGRLQQLLEEPCVAEQYVFLPEQQQQQLMNDLEQLQHEFLEQSLASQTARRQAARATLGFTPPPAAAAEGEHSQEAPGPTVEPQQNTRQQTIRPKKRVALHLESSDEQVTDDSDLDLDDDYSGPRKLPALNLAGDYSRPCKLPATGKHLLTGSRAAQLTAATTTTTTKLNPVPHSTPAAAAAPFAAFPENNASAAAAGADHSRPEGTGPITAEPAARLDPATFSLEDLQQVIRQQVQQGVLNIQFPAEKWVGAIKPLVQLAPGQGSPQRPMQGVLLSALPQHLQTMLDSWTAGINLVSGRAISSRTARDYCDRLRMLLTRVPEVVEVLGQDQVQAMLKQVAATSAQLPRQPPAQHADRHTVAAAAAAATAAGAQPAASAGSVASLAALSRLLSAAGFTADNTARTGSTSMGAAAAGDAGDGGDAAGDVCDMQLDAGPSEAATTASPAPAPAPTNPAAPPTPAAATAHPAPAASPAAAAARAGATAATPDPATFDLEQLYQLLKQRVEQGVLQDKRAAEKWMKPIGPLPKLVTGDMNRRGVLLSTLPQHFQTILDGWVTGKSAKAGRPVAVSTTKTYCNLMANLLTRVPEVVVVLGQDQVQAMLQQIEATYEKLCGRPAQRPTAAAAAAARLLATASDAGAAASPDPATAPVFTAAIADTCAAAGPSAGAAAGPAPAWCGTVTAPAPARGTHTAAAPAPGGGADSEVPGCLAATAAGHTAAANAAGSLSDSMEAAAAAAGDVDARGDGGAEASGDTVSLQQDAGPTQPAAAAAAAAGAEVQGGNAHHQAGTNLCPVPPAVADNTATSSAPPLQWCQLAAGSSSAAASPVYVGPPAAATAAPAAAALEQGSLAQAEEVLLGLCSDSDNIISLSDAVEALTALPEGDARLTMFWRDFKFIARALQMGATTEAVQILCNKLMKHVLQ